MLAGPDSTDAAALRVGLFVDAPLLPAWQHRAVQGLLALPEARIVAVLHCDGAGGSASPGDSALLRLYRRVDRRLFQAAPDALEPTRIEPLLDGIPRRALALEPDGSCPDADLAALRDLRLDVGLWLAAGRPRGALLHAAAHGLWRHFVGGGADGWEVLAGHPTTPSGLLRLADAPSGDVALYRSQGASDPRSAWRSTNRILWKTADFARRVLRDLHAAGQVHPAGGDPAPGGGTAPGTLQTLGGLARLGSRFVRDRLRNRRSREQWQLALRLGGDPLDATGYTPLTPPADRIWADPFPLQTGEGYHVFFEECPFATHRGHIAVMEVDARGRPGPARTVLERDHHLSYPFMLEWEGELYMIPEASESRTVTLYRCTSFPDRWEPHGVLLDDVFAVDPTLFEHDGRWWMFVNQALDGASDWDELHLYHAPRPTGPWTPHRRNPVKSDVLSTRPAGRVFRHGEDWIRPAQECAPRYGHATRLHRIQRLDEHGFQEVEIARIGPEDTGGLATHTLNAAGDLRVLDRKVRGRRGSA